MISKKHLIGGLNTDDAEVLLDSKEYLGALNIRFVTSENGVVGRVTNIEGNTLKNTTLGAGGATTTFVLPTGTNTVIGSKEDLANNRLFFFVKNSLGNHAIYCYDDITGYIYTVLTSIKITGGLNFNSYIHSIDILGSLLSWTDNTTDPRTINVDAAIKANHPTYVANYTYTFPLSYEASTVIKRPPIQALSLTKNINGSYSNNYIRNNSFKFLYQYNYKDYQVSALSSHSDIVPYLSTTSTYNYITVAIPFTETIPDDVQSIDVVVNINGDSNVTIVKTFDRSTSDFTSHNAGTTQLSFDFYNDIIGITLDTIQSTTSFHNVPLKSNTLTYAKNRLFLANNTSGYTTPSTSSLSVGISNYVPISSSITATWKYIRMSKTDGRGANRGYQNVYYAYDASGATNKVYFYVAYFNAGTPPASQAIADATSTWDTETNFIYWYQRNYSAGTGLEWNAGGTVNTTGLTLSLTVSANQLDGVSILKSGSTYNTSIAFYDRFRRKCGVVDLNNKKTISRRDFNPTTYPSTLNWTLSNTNALTEIPDWAYYYQIHVTKSLLTRFFIHDYSLGVYYTTKTSTGTLDHTTKTTYDTSVYAVTIDLSRLNSGGRGYSYQEGDLVRLTKSDNTSYTLTVIGVDGKYLMMSATNIGITVSPTTEVMYEIYTPYQASATEPFYETGPVMPILNPATTTRSYSTLTGLISGDVYPKSVAYGGAYIIETMNPNFTNWQDWQTNTGWINIVTKLGTTVKKNSVQFSDTIIPGTQSNGLNSFQALNESELPIELNGIQRIILTNKVQVEGTVMLAIGKNETSSLYLGESQIFDAQGESFIAKSTGVIGQVNTLRGSYGTINPESAFAWQGSVYWFDANKGTVVRYSTNGLMPISDAKMRKYFIKLGESVLTDKIQVLMGIDPFHEEVYLTIPQDKINPTNTILTDMELSTSSYNFTTLAAGLSTSPSTLTGFTYPLGSGPSTSQSFVYTGTNLPLNGVMTITGSTNYEVSSDGTTFASTLTQAYTGSSYSNTIYVRLKSGRSVASYASETITISTTGISTTVSASGSVTAVPTSVITPSVSTLSAFTYVVGSGPSAAQSFTITATGLTPTSGNLTISVDSNYEISVTSGTTGFGITSLTLAYTASGTLANNTVWVRLKSGLTSSGGTITPYNGTITISGGSASATVSATGTVTSSSITTYSFGTSGYGSSVNNAVTMAYGSSSVTLYSDTVSIAVGSHIYLNSSGGPLTGYSFVFIDGGAWNYNPSTGLVTSYVIPQP